MEEGKAIDARVISHALNNYILHANARYQIWGSVPDYFPPGNEPSRFRPMIQTRNWPFQHPEIYHQNIEAVRSGAYKDFTVQPYKAFLLFPRAPVYDLYTPTPVSNYAHLLQSSWWNGDFQKYGHEALKISSTRAGQSNPLQSMIAFRYNNFKSLLSKFNQPRHLPPFPGYWCLESNQADDSTVTYSLLFSAACWK